MLRRRLRAWPALAVKTTGLLARSLLALLLTIDAFDVGLGLVALGVGLTYSWPIASIVAGAVLLLMAIVPYRRT